MENTLYDIYFRGEIAEGQDLDTVKSRFGEVFNADEKRISLLFSGKPCLLKKGLDKEGALKYQAVLKKTGAKIIIKARSVDDAGTGNQQATAQPVKATASPAPAQAPAETTPAQNSSRAGMPAPDTAATSAQPTEAASAYGLVLAPAGSKVINDSEKQQVQPVTVSTEHIKLASVFAQPETDDTPAPPPPDTTHISIAEAGADLLEGYHQSLDVELPDLSHLLLDEVGVRLSEESIDIPLPEPDLSGFSLAETGSRLSTEDTSPAPTAPDTSHIQLENS